MNDMKLSNANMPGTVRAVDPGVSVAAPPSKSEATSEKAPSATAEVINNKEAAKAASLTEAKSAGSEEKLNEAVTKLNDYIQSVQRNLQFNVDDDSGRMVVKVIDRNTNEVVRQIPDEMALKMAQNLQQDEPLSLFTMKV
jgi:flagellar protein FlaG